jgi:GPH family glycoside/pentoside/hexuronide:cation symporter
MAAALAGGGLLLEATGFDVALNGAQSDATLLSMRLCDILVPMISSAVAIWIVASYEITEEKAHEVRAELERRRGTVSSSEVARASTYP